MRFRLFFTTIIFTLVYSLLIFHIYSLQIEKGEYYTALAESQNRMSGYLEPKRGSIYFTDKNGNPISAAINKRYPTIFAVPKDIADPEVTTAELSGILGIESGKLFTMLNKGGKDQYELLIKKASNDQVNKIRELNLKGIYVSGEELRFYPFKTLASHILGFVSASSEDSLSVGRYGLELYYNDELAGKEGQIKENNIVNPVAGEDIHFTIEPNIQTRAEEILFNLIQKFNAEQGMVIVQEPKTGKILAMGAYPNFDPNDYSEYKIGNFLNTNIQAIFEPGSVMKVITMAGGLDAGKLTADTTYYDSVQLALDGYTIKNWDKKANGKTTMTEVIEKSINTGAAYAQKLLGKDLFYNYLVKFGFGERTGLGLPGEIGGSLGNLKTTSRDINFATASFGQGVSVTNIQMINAFSAIANGGVLMRPYIRNDQDPLVVRRVISEGAAREVTKMMVSAVKKAVVAQIPKFDIAGKTGTAQIPNLKRGGYLEEYVHTYIGFAPAYNPKFTILIRIDKPNVVLAGSTVVPAFRELAEFILNYYNVSPDYME